MRMRILAGLCGVVVTAGVALADIPPDAVVDRLRLHEQLESLQQDVTTLEALNDIQQNPRLRARMADRLNVMRTRIRRIQADLQRAPIPGPPPPAQPPPPSLPAPIAAADFQRFLEAVDQAPFANEKLALVTEACQHHLFTTQNVIAIVEEMPHTSEKVEAAAAMYPRVVDPQNFFQVYEHLPFSSDRDKLRARVAGMRPLAR